MKIANLRGSREGVKAEINNDKELQPHDKAWLCATIDAFAPQYNFVRVDAHAQVHTSPSKNTPAAVIVDIQLVPETVL